MNIVVDLFLVLVIALCALIGKKRGFIKTFFGFFGTLLSFVLTSLISRPVSNVLSETLVYPFLKEHFLSSLADAAGQEVASLDFSRLPEGADAVFSRYGAAAESIRERIASGIQETGEALAEKVSEMVVRPFADSVSYAISFLVLFLVLAILIRLAVKVLDLISKLPGLNFSNRFLGFGIGLIWGFVIALVIAHVLTLAAPAIQGNESAFFSSFDPEKTYLLRFLKHLDVMKLF